MPIKKSSYAWNFENTYKTLPDKLFSKQLPIPVKNPQKVMFNKSLAKELGLSWLSEKETFITDFLSGNKIPEGANPLAQAYAGHQFGHFTMLGDGRAILLGEQITPDHKRYDIQLKGSGQTPYSRRGDGRATLSSMLREYLISEAMHHLGIPTSRSLAVVQTGEKVYRNPVQNGAVLTRVASSHIRVGTFEYVKYFGTKEDLQVFTKYVINRHYPEAANTNNPALELLKVVMQKQIDLLVQWMRVGFIHGVMNTDNMSIAGETIDYGPCAFMNTYNPKTVFSSIDTTGRYAFGNQPKIAHWNLAVFAGSLLPLISEDQEEAMQLARAIIDTFPAIFAMRWRQMMFKKLGIQKPIESDKALLDDLLQLMQIHQADYTNTFLALQSDQITEIALYQSDEFKHWLGRWEKRIAKEGHKKQVIAIMRSQNPVVIPRNHLVESALENAVKGDITPFHELLENLSRPYQLPSTPRDFQTVPAGFDACYQTFCGT